MNVEQEILSDITVFGKYARFLPALGRRETWNEICDRYQDMMIKKYPALSQDIFLYMDFIRRKDILPSMRAMQFAGKAIEINNARIYNCGYLPIDHYAAFSEVMFLLLGGTGVGYSIQLRHVDRLPTIRTPTKTRRYLVGDSIEGWADSVKMLMKAYFGFTEAKPLFDFRDIRQKGARLVTAGGKAPGPEPLARCLFLIEQLLERKENGEKLSTLDCHDILCHIADAVLSGGIRRAAMIALFSVDDDAMLTCKYGNWWELNGQRGRANNSAVIVRNRVTKDDFDQLWEKVQLSGSGEPGIYFTNNADWGTNPCAEIALRPFSFCNLTEINASTLRDQDDFNRRTEAAAFFGTLQAGFTNFHYLRDIWKKTTEKDALIGVGQTGIASGAVLKLQLIEAAEIAKTVNEVVAKKIGINTAARTTTVKPSGTTSCVLGTSSGIHAWHNDYYIRRQRLSKNEALYTHFLVNHPELLEDDKRNPSLGIITLPQAAPTNAILRNESSLNLLERVKKFNLEWVRTGHRRGDNTNNVSATISINEREWREVGEWMWENRYTFNGLSVLPYFGGSYVQAPFEDITKEQFDEMRKHLTSIDLTRVVEMDDLTEHTQEPACAGAVCDVIF